MTTQLRPIPDDLRLAHGGHHAPADGTLGEACLLEAVAYVAGEPWSDRPRCVCPVLAAFGRRWNDTLNDEDRQMLLPYIPRLVGTRSTPEVEARRIWMLTDWLAREFAPGWLRLSGLTAQAETLEGLAPLVDTQTAKAAKPALDQVRKDAAAARDAAGDAARDAARAAARAALAPTTKALQTSALALLDRMIDAGKDDAGKETAAA